jgi:hypothetical protein
MLLQDAQSGRVPVSGAADLVLATELCGRVIRRPDVAAEQLRRSVR